VSIAGSPFASIAHRNSKAVATPFRPAGRSFIAIAAHASIALCAWDRRVPRSPAFHGSDGVDSVIWVLELVILSVFVG
jgi:hypothetical protein